MGQLTGLGLEAIYERAVGFGFKMGKEPYLTAWDRYAEKVYKDSEITEGIEKLAQFLIDNDFKLGLVSASPLLWINWVLDRISFRKSLDVIISIQERPDLHHKPAPDGYLEAIKKLGSNPGKTIILEDSNTGIQSGKAAGAFVIGLKQNLVPGYVQIGADVYAEKVSEVSKFLEERNVM